MAATAHQQLVTTSVTDLRVRAIAEVRTTKAYVQLNVVYTLPWGGMKREREKGGQCEGKEGQTKDKDYI
jgi:hypothetical protein